MSYENTSSYENKPRDLVERNIIISHLCAIPRNIIQKEFGLSRPEIYRIVTTKHPQNPMRGWFDPLVTYYQHTHAHARLHNALHLHLSSEYGLRIREARHYLPGEHGPAAKLVNTLIFGLLTERVVEHYPLEEILDQPGRPHHELFWSIAGAETAGAKARLLVMLTARDHLRKAFMHGPYMTRPMLQRVYDHGVTDEFTRALLSGGLEFLIDRHAKFLRDQSLIESMTTEHEWEALDRRYGLSTNEPLTLEEVGAADGTTKANAEQHVKNGLRRLRNVASLPRSVHKTLETLPPPERNSRGQD